MVNVPISSSAKTTASPVRDGLTSDQRVHDRMLVIKHKFLGRENIANTFGISISRYNNFIPWRGSKARLPQTWQKLPSKTVARDKCVRDAFCLDGPANFRFRSKHGLCRLHRMGFINIIPELRWQKPL
jgi:hypothetical protein